MLAFSGYGGEGGGGDGFRWGLSPSSGTAVEQWAQYSRG